MTESPSQPAIDVRLPCVQAQVEARRLSHDVLASLYLRVLRLRCPSSFEGWLMTSAKFLVLI